MERHGVRNLTHVPHEIAVLDRFAPRSRKWFLAVVTATAAHLATSPAHATSYSCVSGSSVQQDCFSFPDRVTWNPITTSTSEQFIRPTPMGVAATSTVAAKKNGDPVSANGEFIRQVIDYTLPAHGEPFVFKRTYRSGFQYKGALGFNWDHNYNQRVMPGGTCDDPTIDYHDGELNIVHFKSSGTTADGHPLYLPKEPVPLLMFGIQVFDQYYQTEKDGYVIVDLVSGRNYGFGTSGRDPLHSKLLSYIQSGDFDTLWVYWTWAYQDNNLGFPENLRPLVDHVIEPGGRTIHYYYNNSSYDFLKCISFGADCATNPIASFTISDDPGLPSYGELTMVTLASDTTGEQYQYDDGHITTSGDYVPEDALQPTCGSLCNTTIDPITGQPACSNLKTCTAEPTYCSSIQSSSGDCLSYCNYGGPDPCYTGNWSSDCESACNDQCGTSNGQVDEANRCLTDFNTALPFCSPIGSQCTPACLDFYRRKDPNSGNPQYTFGNLIDSTHNLMKVLDGSNRLVVSNGYGLDITDVSFNRVVRQEYGTGQVASFQYHDLQLEASPPSWTSTPPSPPNNTDVVPLASFMSMSLCHNCALGSQSCDSAPTTDVDPPKSQSPTHAVVFTDIYGYKHVQYFDANQGWALLREINRTTGETTDYNYTNGFLTGIQFPLGVRSCTQIDTHGLPQQIDHLPAPGMPGGAVATQETFSYDTPASSFQPPRLTRHVLDIASGAYETFDHSTDSTVVTGIHRSLSASTNPSLVDSWGYDYVPSGSSSFVLQTETRPDGTKTQYSYFDPYSQAARTISVDAFGVSPVISNRTFDYYGDLLTSSQPNRIQHMWDFDLVHRIQHHLWKKGTLPWWTETYQWNYSTDQISTTSDSDKTTQYSTDSAGHTWSTTLSPVNVGTGSPLPQTTCRNISDDGRLLDVIGPEGEQTHYDYDGAGRLRTLTRGYPASAPTPSWAAPCYYNADPPPGDPGIEQVAAYDYFPGGALMDQTVGGVTTSYVVDGFGRTIQRKDNYGVGRWTRYGYDTRGRTIWMAVYDGPDWYIPPYNIPHPTDPGIDKLTTYTYDDFNRPLTVAETMLHDGQGIRTVTTTTSYDDVHSTVTTQRDNRIVTRVFDGAGRVVSETLPDTSQITYNYTDGTSVVKTTETNFGSYVETTALDEFGLPSSVTKAGEVVGTISRDTLGRLATESKTGAGSKNLYYDAFGRLADTNEQTDSSHTRWRHTDWDRENRTVLVKDADQHPSTMQYDGLGRVFIATDPMGRSTVVHYVPGSSLVDHKDFASGRTQQFTYDGTGALVAEVTHDPDIPFDLTRQFGYDPLGRINDATISGGREIDNETQLAYDSLGRLTLDRNSLNWSLAVGATYSDNDQARWLGFQSRTISESFDKLGRKTAAEVQGNYTISQTWDYGIRGVGGPLGSTTGRFSLINQSYSYDGRGRLTQVAAASQTAPIMSASVAFGVDGVPRAKQRSVSGGDLMTDVFETDYLGRVNRETEGVSGVPQFESGNLDNSSVSQYFAASNAWKQSTYNNESDPASIEYPLGLNRSITSTRTYDGMHRLVSRSEIDPPTYDADDRATTVPTAYGANIFTYDALDEMVTASDGTNEVDYVYDALGRRIMETSQSASTSLIWYGNEIIAHGSDSDGYTLELYGPQFDEHVLATNLTTGTQYAYFNDPSGSPIATYSVDASTNAPIELYSYSAFGTPTLSTPDGWTLDESLVGNRFLFQGQLFDTLTATYSMRFREYDPDLAQFHSRDPIGLAGGPDLFSFAGAAPLNHWDPSGLVTVGENRFHPKWMSLPTFGTWGDLTAGGSDDGTEVSYTPYVTPDGVPIVGPPGTFPTSDASASQAMSPESIGPPSSWLAQAAGGLPPGPQPDGTYNLPGVPTYHINETTGPVTADPISTAIDNEISMFGRMFADSPAPAIGPPFGCFGLPCSPLEMYGRSKWAIAIPAPPWGWRHNWTDWMYRVSMASNKSGLANFAGGMAAAGASGAGTLYHYTNEVGHDGILDTNSLNPSLKAVNPNDVRYGDGQYLSDIVPGTMTSAQLSRAFLGMPFQGDRFTHYVEIDVSGLNVVQGRPGVFVVPNDGPLDLTGRIVSSGPLP